MAAKKAFKYDTDTAYCLRYEGCGNLFFYDAGGTKKEFEAEINRFRKQCARDCEMMVDEIVIELYEFSRYIKGTTRVSYNWDADAPENEECDDDDMEDE